MPQVGIYSAYQLGLHNHLNASNGGILNEYSRYGAYRSLYRTGALALHVDNDAETNLNNAIYIKMKEIQINEDYEGQIRVAWQAHSSVALQEIRTRFYLNGVAVGAECDEDVVAYQDEVENYDVGLVAGDLFQIYGKRVGACVCYVRNFRLYYDWRLAHFGDGTIMNLATPVALSDADLIDVTNTVV